MSKEDKIKRELQEMWFILLNAKTAYYYAEYLTEPPTPEEQSYMRHYGVEMQFFRSVLWRNSVIEISNLFVRTKDTRDIFKFLNKLENEYRGAIPKESINNLRGKLANYSSIIQKVKLLRNEVFAHADKSYRESLQYNVLDKDVSKLILFAEEFISQIFLEFGDGVIHNSPLLKDDFYVLKVLNAYEENKHNDIINNYKKFIQ